ncbi:MAG: tetraacyldisaccharide 4'-kinase [Hyphomonas sp.]|nr:tetraacyldisaccharide 4'-kinase [Hyphomonas sp.]MCB9972714.1 tetraacyldisaccharide 4'-kinase [Hyphomonas sp.]MCC0017522.1 tetraacyldisaccharide 4'-kinase [Rhodobiaceae bacterium]
MKAPHFWSAGLDPRSREAAPLIRILLTPLAALYTMGIRRKLANAKPAAVPVPIICVGNLTVGGVGKTPVVEAIRRMASEAGLRAASLSRGYGGSLSGPLRVDPAGHAAAEVGDEPLMLAASGEAWIGRDRAEAARAMAADGVRLIVMDDGHQNPSVAKDLSLIVIDAAAPFGNGFVLPKGPLREPVADGLTRAQGVVLMGEGKELTAVQKSRLPVLRAAIAPSGAVPEGPLVAFAGIGRPVKFFDGLKAAGADLREGVPYGDHHVFTASDLRFLHDLAASHGARLITTTKDHVRLPADERQRILAFPVEARFEDEAALRALLAPVLHPAKAR